MSPLSKLYFFVGPTASGKSHWALKFAQDQQTPILNGDSLQVYQRVNIGTAKPSAQERALTPHYLFDFVSPPKEFTAGDYFQSARQKITELSNEPRIFVVGGSGFYLQALEKGMYDAPEPSDKVKVAIENRRTSLGEESLWLWLNELDPVYCGSISKNDQYRIKRGLEMVLSSKKTMHELQQEFEKQRSQLALKNPLHKIGLWAERSWLEPRVTYRCKKMIAQGLVEEVEGLLQEGLEEWSPLASVGYAETVALIRGEFKQEEYFEKLVRNTLYLAKRQRTWFKRDKNIKWFDAGLEANQLSTQLKNYIDKGI